MTFWNIVLALNFSAPIIGLMKSHDRDEAPWLGSWCIYWWLKQTAQVWKFKEKKRIKEWKTLLVWIFCSFQWTDCGISRPSLQNSFCCISARIGCKIIEHWSYLPSIGFDLKTYSSQITALFYNTRTPVTNFFTCTTAHDTPPTLMHNLKNIYFVPACIVTYKLCTRVLL